MNYGNGKTKAAAVWERASERARDDAVHGGRINNGNLHRIRRNLQQHPSIAVLVPTRPVPTFQFQFGRVLIFNDLTLWSWVRYFLSCLSSPLPILATECYVFFIAVVVFITARVFSALCVPIARQIPIS